MNPASNGNLQIVRGFKTSQGSGKIVRDGTGEYFLEVKKYLFGFTVKRRLEKCRNLDAADDALNDLQSQRNFW
ncbi:MAG: hypothetical protein SCALA702_25610 [Melioribacteraceae bacterium]|nr:MAG: hypothetical protein SCALA702_25610 [Melioribacteraceae bacterium]